MKRIVDSKGSVNHPNTDTYNAALEALLKHLDYLESENVDKADRLCSIDMLFTEVRFHWLFNEARK